jgi:hypothetical protein
LSTKVNQFLTTFFMKDSFYCEDGDKSKKNNKILFQL